jgi:hypothetical protein
MVWRNATIMVMDVKIGRYSIEKDDFLRVVLHSQYFTLAYVPGWSIIPTVTQAAPLSSTDKFIALLPIIIPYIEYPIGNIM